MCLAEGCADDAIVGDFGVEAVLHEQVALDAIDLNLDGPASWPVVHAQWMCK